MHRRPCPFVMLIFAILLFAWPSESGAQEPPPPKDAAPSQAVEVSFTGTVRSIELGCSEGSLMVGFDAHFTVVVHVDEVRQAAAPVSPGTDAAFVVHSPALLFEGREEHDIIGQRYAFELSGEVQNGKWYFSHLSAKPVDDANRATTQPSLARGGPAVNERPNGGAAEAKTPSRVRFATFNIWELTVSKLAPVDADGHGTTPQLCKAAEIVQRIRPDVLLLNEIDFDSAERKNAALFMERYLKVPQSGQAPIEYPHIFFEPVNTGVPTGLDLNRDGQTGGPDDAFGFGKYPGQYGMALYSRFPLDRAAARTFQNLKWMDQPGNLLPDGTGGKPKWYDPLTVAVFRLSSKSHWDVPVRLAASGGERVIHVLAAHPTPPVFDGAEDRNGRRNFDEIRLWADYLAGGDRAAYLVDDQGRRGGLAPDASFVILGDMNADPDKAERAYGMAAIAQLLRSPRVQDPRPRQQGLPAPAASSSLRPSVPSSLPAQHSAPSERSGDPGAPGSTQPSPATQHSAPSTQHSGLATADFGRIDYVLPSTDLTVVDSGVFWPPAGDPLHRLVTDPEPSSDHRLVWVDLELRP
jgi:hypothetical protein